MWLDRFSGHSTPSQSPPPPHNRSHAPAPTRRPSQFGQSLPSRPAYGPRTSSLNLGSRLDTSTTSVNSQRLANGSTLKHEVSPPADYPDPLEVLEVVVGKPLRQNDRTNGALNSDGDHGKPAELLADIDFGGLSLEDFAQSADHESEFSDIAARVTAQTVEECEYVCSDSLLAFAMLSCTR